MQIRGSAIVVRPRRRCRTPPPRKRGRRRRGRKINDNDVFDDPRMVLACFVVSIALVFAFNLSSQSFVRKHNRLTSFIHNNVEVKIFINTIVQTLKTIFKILLAYAEETMYKLHRYFSQKGGQRDYDSKEPRCVYLQYVYATVKSFDTFIPDFVPTGVIDGLSAYRCHETLHDKIILLAFVKFWLYMIAFIITFLASLDWIIALILLPFHALKFLVYVSYCSLCIVI